MEFHEMYYHCLCWMGSFRCKFPLLGHTLLAAAWICLIISSPPCSPPLTDDVSLGTVFRIHFIKTLFFRKESPLWFITDFVHILCWPWNFMEQRVKNIANKAANLSSYWGSERLFHISGVIIQEKMMSSCWVTELWMLSKGNVSCVSGKLMIPKKGPLKRHLPDQTDRFRIHLSVSQTADDTGCHCSMVAKSLQRSFAVCLRNLKF